MKEFISDLGVIPSASGPMKIFCDNTGAIALKKESRFHKRTKHMCTSVMIRVCHSRSHFLSCMYIHDDFMTESR